MQSEFFLIRVRRLQQFLFTFLIAVSAAISNIANADELTLQWQSPLLQEHPLTGRIIDTRSGNPLNYRELIERLNAARFILIGEKHDNPDHHQLEHRLLQDLLSLRTYLVVLEMLDEQQDSGLKTLHSSSKTETDNIRKTLDWDSRGWLWEDYGTLVTLSLNQAQQLRSGNISRRLLREIYKESEHPILNSPRFQSMPAINQDQIDIIRQQVFDSHCGTLPMEHTAPMARIQIARDASMASALHRSAEENTPAILVAGAFHIRNDYGVPAHLRALGYQSLATVQLQEVETDRSDWRAYLNTTEQPDYLWFTPKFTAKDYCDALRKKDGEKGSKKDNGETQR